MRYLLDTSALLAHYRQEDGWKVIQAIFEANATDVLIASISLTEFGRRLRALGATENEANETLTYYQMLFTEVVSVDTAVARTAFAIACRTPRRLPLADALIAAAAQSKVAVLVHRDEHMRTIPAELVQQQDLALPPTALN